MPSIAKKLGCVLLLSLGMVGVGPAHAGNTTTASQNAEASMAPDWQKTCKTYAVWGEAAMKAHQQGIRLDKVFARANDPVFDGIRKHLLKIVVKAYESPLADSEQAQNKVQREFYNDVYLQCAKERLQDE